MHKTLSFLFFLAVSFFANSQELNCTFTINYDQVGVSNKQVFKTLEKSVNQFLNTTKWTDKVYEKQEKVTCGFTLIINSYSANSFGGSLQVNAVRPVYDSGYMTPVFNHKDNSIAFDYQEYEPLIYNPVAFNSNLVSLLSFYVYMILASDADTFALKGGESFYREAMNVATLAQQGGADGWSPKRNSLNRFSMVDLMLSNAHKEYREVMYGYHRLGMDVFSSDTKKAKTEILRQLMKFEALNKRSQTSFLFRVFFNAKADEVVDVFTNGPKMDVSKLKKLLNRISATNSAQWAKL